MTYSLVKNGAVVSSGLSRPQKIGNTYIGAASDIRQFGYYPEVGNRPATGIFETAIIDTATLNGDVVDVTYEIVQLPPPDSISKRQGKQQLVIAGLDTQVEAAIDGITDEIERKLTKIWYNDSDSWDRDNAQLLALATALGLTETQVDDLFKAASQL